MNISICLFLPNKFGREPSHVLVHGSCLLIPVRLANNNILYTVTFYTITLLIGTITAVFCACIATNKFKAMHVTFALFNMFSYNLIELLTDEVS